MADAAPAGTQQRHDHAAAYAMAAPGLLLVLLFVGLPFFLAVVLSLTDLRIGSPYSTQFTGLAQYRRILSDPSFLDALGNNLFFAGVVVPVQTALALGLALLLNREMAGRAIYRTLFFMPVVFPMSLIAVVWSLIYAPGPEGLLNAALSWAIPPQDWLHHPQLALPAIMVLSIWQGLGFQMVVLLAGLQGIPHSLYEAAKVDRAGAWSRFLHITLPQLRNPLIFTVLVTTILAFRVFDQVQILTQGGPLDASTTLVYEAVVAIFERMQAGAAFAITVVMFLIVFAITLVQRRLIREEREIS